MGARGASGSRPLTTSWGRPHTGAGPAFLRMRWPGAPPLPWETVRPDAEAFHHLAAHPLLPDGPDDGRRGCFRISLL